MAKAKKIVLHFMGEQYPMKQLPATKRPKKKPNPIDATPEGRKRFAKLRETKR